MKLRVDSLDVRQRDRLVQKLLVERKRKASVQAVSVEHGDAEDPSDEVEVGKMVRVDACDGAKVEKVEKKGEINIKKKN